MVPLSLSVPATEEKIQLLKEIHEEVKMMIKIAGDQAKRNYERGVQLQPSFQIGDKVLPRHDNISTIAPTKKLESKYLGPFSIISKLSDLIYRLKLPKALCIHNVFHVFLLKKYRPDTILGHKHKPPPSIITLEGDIEWEVSKILDSRLSG